jgi:hypothetical protein
MNKYHAIANTNEFGLTKGKQYIVETGGIGTVYVYDVQGNYITYCRMDSFDNYKLI